jgi:hypothetical protein
VSLLGALLGDGVRADCGARLLLTRLNAAATQGSSSLVWIAEMTAAFGRVADVFTTEGVCAFVVPWLDGLVR